MGKKSVAKLPSPYYILRVDRIPTNVTFYQLLSRIAPYSRFIIGVARTADYRNKRLGSTIYFYCTSLIDARFITQTDIRFVEDGRDAQYCLIMDSVLGRASLSHLSMEDRFHQTPVTVHVKGLERQFGPAGSTTYLMQMLPQYEIGGVITSFRINFDVRRQSTREDAFITFLYQRDGRSVGGEFEPIEHIYRGRNISCMLSDNVPMMVGLPEAYNLTNGLCEWNLNAENINQLIIRRRSPAVQDSNRESNNKTTNQSLNVTQKSCRQVLSSIIQRPVVQQQATRKLVPLVASIIVRPHQPSTTTVNPSASTKSTNPSTLASSNPSTSKAPIPARGKDAKSPPINNWLKAKSKTFKQNDKVSTKAVQSKNKVSKQKKVELMLNSSEEEIIMVTKKKDENITQRATRSSRNRATESSAAPPESEDEGRLIINEIVNLSDDEEEQKKDV
ncbi:hypothetical protein ACKWTF_014250 [Chironomus riparius]